MKSLMPLLLAACWMNPPAPTTPIEPTAATPHVQDADCGGHAFDFSASGSGLDAYEGHRVWAIALMNQHARTVRLEGTIVHGAFALRCPKSIDRDNSYPATAVVIDADGDGKCSANDRSSSRQYYAWNFDVVAGFDASAAEPVSQEHTVVGDHDSFDFCERYFK